MAHVDHVKEGVSNLVNHCAGVQKRDNVLILNEYGKVDPEVANLVVDAVKQAGVN